MDGDKSFCNNNVNSGARKLIENKGLFMLGLNDEL